MKRVFKWFIFVISTFALVFLSGFDFDNPLASAHSRYTSEIACSSKAKSRICVPEIQPDIRLFRGNPDEPKVITDFGSRYTSQSFASFLNLFIESGDSLREVIVKTFLVKSLIATYIFGLLLFYASRFTHQRNFILQLLVLMFSVPYLSFGISSVYPAPLAILAFSPILVIFRVILSQIELSKKSRNWMFGNFMFLSVVIMSNRFETTVFLGLGIVLLILQSFFERQRNSSRRYLCIIFVIYSISLTFFMVVNRSLFIWFSGLLSSENKVLTIAEAQSSKAVQKVGDFGLSVMAPVTMLDNSSRNIYRQFGDAFFERISNGSALDKILNILGYIFVFLSWTPVVILLGMSFLNTFKMKDLETKFGIKYLIRRIPNVVILFCYVIIPFYARVPWFLWYVLPILMLFFCFAGELYFPWLKGLFLLPIAINSIGYFASNFAFGNLKIGGQNLSGLNLGLLWVLLALGCLSVIKLITEND